jgi:uncharacterized protein YecT (DUF1311 family)
MSRQTITFFALLLVSMFGNSYAQSWPCLDLAQSEKEADTCGRAMIDPLDNAVAAQFQRLTNKFKDSKEMLELLNVTDQDWKGYWNTQCMFEGMATAGGQISGKLPLAANKAYLICIRRFLLERQAALAKF